MRKIRKYALTNSCVFSGKAREIEEKVNSLVKELELIDLQLEEDSK